MRQRRPDKEQGATPARSVTTIITPEAPGPKKGGWASANPPTLGIPPPQADAAASDGEGMVEARG